MIANIASDDALIPPHHANPAGLTFRKRQEASRSSRCAQNWNRLSAAANGPPTRSEPAPRSWTTICPRTISAAPMLSINGPAPGPVTRTLVMIAGHDYRLHHSGDGFECVRFFDASWSWRTAGRSPGRRGISWSRSRCWVRDVSSGATTAAMSADMPGNTDETWSRTLDWLVRNRLLAPGYGLKQR